jgi:hypothetical protein
MLTHRSFSARRIFLILAASAVLLLTGCEVTITNLTPTTLPANPSQIYTLSTRVSEKAANIVPGSLTVRLIIDGQSFPMKKSPLGRDIYELEYQLPPGRDEIAYYYLVNYKFENNGMIIPREQFTDVVHSKVLGRYVLSLEVNRGPVGARVGLLGRGFTAQDKVTFDGTAARTVCDSPSSISFFVPAVTPGRNYKVELSSPGGVAPIGTFRVDATTVTVSPTALQLVTGQSQTLAFTLPYPAPAGGQLLDLTTDIPESVIMPEVVVPTGSNTISVPVTGGRPGTGSLFLKGYGEGETVIPVTVR